MEARRSEGLKASPQMFESRFLDFFSRVHPAVPPLIFAPAVVIFFVTGAGRMPDEKAAGLALVGYLLWTLSEYWLHRVVFHFEPDTAWGARLHFIIHGVHHDHPNDPMRLVMPPSLSVPLAALFFGLFVVLFATPDAYAVAAGFFAGYLAYDMTHYHLHHHQARTRVGKHLRELHMRHHFQDHERGFGVSAPYWDRAFGTALRRGRK